jgi:hypothetical protein
MKRFFEDVSAKAATAAKVVTYTAAIVIAVATTGCSVGLNAPNSDNALQVSSAALQGIVHGGDNPISGAHIQIWAVGTTGSGSAATPLLTSGAVTTGSDGSFTIASGNYTAHSITSACSAGSTQWYMTAYSGNPGNGDSDLNPDAELAVALGSCGNLTSSTDIVINEVSTAAAAYALGQFFGVKSTADSTDNPNGDGFGTSSSSGQAYTGITNAMATAMSLSCSVTSSACSTPTGAPVSTITYTGTASTVTGDQITVTPEATKLATTANILAACVQSDPLGVGGSTACTTLLADVAYSGAPVADTLQAAVNMSLNPTSVTATNPYPGNLVALYGLQTAQSPFPGVSSQPLDWTLGIQYTGATPLITSPFGLAVDSLGNIWTINQYTNGSTQADGDLVELSPTGFPLFESVLSGSGQTLLGATPRGIAIDTSNDVFIATSSSSAYAFEQPAGYGTPVALGLGKGTYSPAVDENNDVFFAESSATTGTNPVYYEFTDAPVNGMTTANEVEFSGDSTSVTPKYIVVDTSGNVWSSAEGGSNVLEMSSINITGCTYPTCTTSESSATYTPVTAGSLSTPYGMAAGPSGSIWVANAVTDGTLTYLTGAVGSTTGTAYGGTSGTMLDKPEYVAVDGFGNVWASNNGTGGVSELSGGAIPTTTYAFGATPPSLGTLISPLKGSTGTFDALGFRHSGLSGSQGIAIDPAGNVWVGNSSSSGAGSITEIVGAAAPTVTPIAAGLATGLNGTVY